MKIKTEELVSWDIFEQNGRCKQNQYANDCEPLVLITSLQKLSLFFEGYNVFQQSQ